MYGIIQLLRLFKWKFLQHFSILNCLNDFFSKYVANVSKVITFAIYVRVSRIVAQNHMDYIFFEWCRTIVCVRQQLLVPTFLSVDLAITLRMKIQHFNGCQNIYKSLFSFKWNRNTMVVDEFGSSAKWCMYTV